MAGRCTCDGCLTGRWGAYTTLVHSAKPDFDQARKQAAMTAISTIAPFAGGDDTTAVDSQAAPVLNQLYPLTSTSNG